MKYLGKCKVSRFALVLITLPAVARAGLITSGDGRNVPDASSVPNRHSGSDGKGRETTDPVGDRFPRDVNERLAMSGMRTLGGRADTGQSHLGDLGLTEPPAGFDQTLTERMNGPNESQEDDSGFRVRLSDQANLNDMPDLNFESNQGNTSSENSHPSLWNHRSSIAMTGSPDFGGGGRSERGFRGEEENSETDAPNRYDIAAVPEPRSAVLMVTGSLVLMGAVAHRRRGARLIPDPREAGGQPAPSGSG